MGVTQLAFEFLALKDGAYQLQKFLRQVKTTRKK